jgi:hypothetical protein
MSAAKGWSMEFMWLFIVWNVVKKPTSGPRAKGGIIATIQHMLMPEFVQKLGRRERRRFGDQETEKATVFFHREH